MLCEPILLAQTAAQAISDAPLPQRRNFILVEALEQDAIAVVLDEAGIHHDTELDAVLLLLPPVRAERPLPQTLKTSSATCA